MKINKFVLLLSAANLYAADNDDTVVDNYQPTVGTYVKSPSTRVLNNALLYSPSTQATFANMSSLMQNASQANAHWGCINKLKKGKFLPTRITDVFDSYSEKRKASVCESIVFYLRDPITNIINLPHQIPDFLKPCITDKTDVVHRMVDEMADVFSDMGFPDQLVADHIKGRLGYYYEGLEKPCSNDSLRSIQHKLDNMKHDYMNMEDALKQGADLKAIKYIIIPQDISPETERALETLFSTYPYLHLHDKNPLFKTIEGARLTVLNGMISSDFSTERVINVAILGMKLNDEDIRRRAISLFINIVEHNVIFKEATQAAIQAAIEGMTSTDEKTRQRALDLFGVLVKKGQAFKEAIQAAIEGITSTDEETRQKALNLFQNLVGKGQAFKEATQAATEGITSTDEETRNHALYLFQALVKNGQAIEEATLAASKTVELIEKAIIERDIQVVSKSMASIEKASEETIQAVIGEAIQAASKSMASIEKTIQEALKKMASIRKNHLVDRKGNLFNSGYLSWYQSLELGEALNVFHDLVAKGQAIEEATQAASKILKFKGNPKPEQDVFCNALNLSQLIQSRSAATASDK